MDQKWKIIISTIVVVCLFMLGGFIVFSNWFFSNLFPAYIETIELNWDVSLPPPNHKKTIESPRGGFHGDGDAITELQYDQAKDIENIKELSDSWINGKMLEAALFPDRIGELLSDVDHEAEYFYLKKNGTDYIIFELKGKKLTIYESYL